jgi:hypothetical protein
MTLDINFEILTIMTTSLIFTILYLLTSDTLNRIIIGFITSLCWIILSFTVLASPPTFEGISWLFMGLGLVFIILIFKDVYILNTERKQRLEP